MNLYHTSAKTSSVLNNTWRNSSGQAIYKVHTPSSKGNRTTTIYRITPSESSRPDPDWKSRESVHPDKQSLDVESDDGSVEALEFLDNFVKVGEIDWVPMKSAILKRDGQEMPSDAYFRKEGWGWYGKNRAFVAPDGRELIWVLGDTAKLILNDGSKRTLAQFHRRSLGLFSSKGSQPAYLEIVPGYESMVDLIFFTFIFVEKIRKDQERGLQNIKGD